MESLNLSNTSSNSVTNELSPQQSPINDDYRLTPFELSEIIHELDEKRKQFEEDGFYLEAQQVVNKIKELQLAESQKVAHLIALEKKRTKEELEQRHKAELEEFEEKWRGKFEEYDNQAKMVALAVIERHKLEKTETESYIRSQMYLKKPKFSKEVLNMKNMLQKLVKQKIYEEADALRRQIKQQELKEIAEFEKSQEAIVRQKLAFIETKHQQELDRLKLKISKGKTELQHQKESELEQLKRHQHAFTEIKLRNTVL